MGKKSYRLIAWGVIWLLTIGSLRATLLAAEICPASSKEELHLSAKAAANWIVQNQSDNGRYLYEVKMSEAGSPVISDGYNLVRHAGTTMALYQIVEEGEPQYLEAADAGLKYLLDRSVGNEEILAVAEGSADAKLGTASLLAISLIKRRAATGDKQYDQTLEMLGNFIITMQREDGSMLYLWDQQTASPVPEITSLFATGEALWALASLHNLFPEKGWDHLAFRTLDYMATQRDEDENVWPRPWADQWAAYSLNEMSEWGLSEIHIQYARELAAQFGIAVRWESQRNGGLDGLVHSPEPIAAGQGTWIEAIGMLHQLSEDEPRLEDLRIPLQERLLCAAGRMRVKQTTGTGTVEFDGGWFTGGVSRVDGQQHALSGLLFAALSLDKQEQ